MKKGIRSDQNNRKVLTSKKVYDCVATQFPDGRMVEIHKSYVFLDVFSDNGFLKTKSDYKCPYCNTREKTDNHNKTEEGEKITLELHCRKCKQLLLSETFSKKDL
jgi:hypothetical protein